MTKTRLFILLAILVGTIGIWLFSFFKPNDADGVNDDLYVAKPEKIPTRDEMRSQKFRIGLPIPDRELVDLTSEELNLVQTMSADYQINYETYPDIAIYGHNFDFLNFNYFEIASLEIEHVVKNPGRQGYRCVTTVNRFVNATIPINGPIVGLHRASVVGVRMAIPMDEWRVGTSMTFHILGGKKFKKRPSANTVRGIREALLPLKTEQEQIEFLKDHPDIPSILDKNSKISGTLMVFASALPGAVEYLMEHGGDAKSKDMYGAGIMHYAAHGHKGVAEVAKKYGGDVHAKDLKVQDTPLHYAIMAISYENVPALVKLGADVNAKNGTGTTPTLYAAKLHYPQLMEALLDNGADIHVVDSDGYSLLHLAGSSRAMMQLLLDRKLPIDIRNKKNGETPYLYAVKDLNDYAFEFLIKRGANVNLKDNLGRDAFEISKEGNTLKTDRFFRERLDTLKNGGVLYGEGL